jgi:hypothetical protein
MAPDAMDHVQQHNDDHVADALSAHARRARFAGRSSCANLDCGDAIAPERTALGAQLCLPCQKAEEGQAVHMRRWSQR